MAEQTEVLESEHQAGRQGAPAEIVGLLKLVRRLENENASLRRELATRRLAA